MTLKFRGNSGVEKLLKLARSDADARRVDLSEVERAKQSAQEAVDAIAQTLDDERAVSTDPAGLALFEEAMRERRFNLRRTVASLDVVCDDLREKMRISLAEIAKLEHVLAVNNRDAATADRRREARA